MSIEKDQLIAALDAAEAAIQALAAARTAYAPVFHELHRSAFADPRNHRQETLAAAISTDRFDILIAARMRSLGLGAILDTGISGARVDDLSALTASIDELVS